MGCLAGYRGAVEPQCFLQFKRRFPAVKDNREWFLPDGGFSLQGPTL